MIECFFFVQLLKGWAASATVDKVGAVLYTVPFVYLFFLLAFTLKQVVRSRPVTVYNKTPLI